MFDPDFDDSLEESDGVFGNQLFKGDQKPGLQRDPAAHGGEAPRGIAGEGEPGDVDDESEEIWDQRDDEEEFSEFGGAPCALEVLAAVEEGGKGDEEGEDVLLDEGGGEEGPGEDNGEGGDDSEERDGEVLVGRGGASSRGSVGLPGNPVTVAERTGDDGEGDGYYEGEPG